MLRIKYCLSFNFYKVHPFAHFIYWMVFDGDKHSEEPVWRICFKLGFDTAIKSMTIFDLFS